MKRRRMEHLVTTEKIGGKRKFSIAFPPDYREIDQMIYWVVYRIVKSGDP